MLKVAEANLFVQVFERETNREKNLEKAAKEAKVKARKEAAKTSDNDKDRAMDEQDILKVGVGLHIAVQALTMTLEPAGHVAYGMCGWSIGKCHIP